MISDRESRFATQEDGGITVLNLFLLVCIAMLGGVAIDMANLVTARTQLQVAADVAAHAAIVTRDTPGKSADEAKTKALEMAALNMPSSAYGAVLSVDNIHFGTYDKAARAFTIDEDVKGAVYVETDRISENANAVTAFLMHIVGYDAFDVVATSIFETYRPPCLREGFVAQDVVDIQSGNEFTNGFCVHSNTEVGFNIDNLFEEGTIVSMPDSTEVDLPSSGFEKNEGLEAALRDGSYWIKIVNDLENDVVETQMTTGTGDNYVIEDLVLNATINFTPPTGNAKIEMADLETAADDYDADDSATSDTANDAHNRIFEIGCGANGKLTIGNEAPFENVVIMTDCDIEFGQGTQIIGTTILTRSTESDSVKAPSGLIIGDDDDCGEGGGSQILTHGGVTQASNVSIFGSRIVAVGDVAFAASNDGIEGASVISGGRIDMTSGSVMGFCGTGWTNMFEAEYFRMAG